MSLDVENLFMSIPKEKIINFLRDKSHGWGTPQNDNEKEPKLYKFDMDSRVFCDLVELCLKYNQFQVEGRFFRQTHGLFMGSSISPPLAMMYLEYFESYLYEQRIPEGIKAREWKSYIEDCFIVYEHGDAEFDDFMKQLNELDEHINFTVERSKTGMEVGLNSEVVEALPFLDLLVTRCLDPQSNTLSNKICIYRKACHKGSYVHAFSSQPTAVKRAVIRNMFLCAFRYCDTLFLKAQESKIYSDFEKLGYSRNFITKAKLSARQGRDREIMLRANPDEHPLPRERSQFHINLPYNRISCKLSHQFRERGGLMCLTQIRIQSGVAS